jgi:RNA polymerase sigma-70 factor (ECF subfamily)
VERDAIAELYRRHGPMVLRRARALLRDEQAALDALQEVFVRALSSGARFRGDASPATWLYRIATNHCLNLLRDVSRRRALWEEHGARGEPETTAATAESRLQIAQIVEHVRPELQEIAFYYFVDQMNHEEIAEILGVSRRTVGHRLDEFRAAVKLRLVAVAETR